MKRKRLKTGDRVVMISEIITEAIPRGNRGTVQGFIHQKSHPDNTISVDYDIPVDGHTIWHSRREDLDIVRSR